MNAQSSGPVKVLKNGMYIAISPVTAANQGEYMCLVKRENSETIKMYNITVVGEIDPNLVYNNNYRCHGCHFITQHYVSLVAASIGFTIKVNQGSHVHLPCFLPRTTQESVNARWFKEAGERLETEGKNNTKIELLYPEDYDQTILVKHVAMEDTGVYHCESPDGETLSTVYLIVEGRLGIIFYTMPHGIKVHTSLMYTLPNFLQAAAKPESNLCEKFTAPWEACTDKDSRTGVAVLQESMTEFSMSLYSHLRHIHPTSNLLFSPISISGVLSHLLLGRKIHPVVTKLFPSITPIIYIHIPLFFRNCAANVLEITL